MIKVIGKENCGRCYITKKKLEQKEITFEYQDINSISKENYKKYILQARKKGLMNLPLIIKDEEVISLEEIL